MLRNITICLGLAASLIGCQPPVGKDEYRRDTNLRDQTLKDCANGTHASARECANAQDVRDLDDLKRSL